MTIIYCISITNFIVRVFRFHESCRVVNCLSYIANSCRFLLIVLAWLPAIRSSIRSLNNYFTAVVVSTLTCSSYSGIYISKTTFSNFNGTVGINF
ncbi:Uncharacterised protein [Neisseria meningitidis]|nr:Uncharacterised protein [Neisseria meningitidis]